MIISTKQMMQTFKLISSKAQNRIVSSFREQIFNLRPTRKKKIQNF